MMYDKRITVLQVVHPCMGSGQSIMFESLKKNARFWLCCFREVSSRGHPGLLSSESTVYYCTDVRYPTTFHRQVGTEWQGRRRHHIYRD
jgi:hypothetical protein